MFARHKQHGRRGGPPGRGPLTLYLAVSLGAAMAGFGAQAPNIPFDRLSLEQGLSQGTVNCILQDREGFLWLGTQSGLNRYDGYRFHVFKNDPTDPSSLPSSWIESLAEGPSGDLWIGTRHGGLARWRPSGQGFERFQHDSENPASLPGNQVRVLHFDRSGQLWIGTSQSGLARYDEKHGVFERFRHDPDDGSSLADDRVRSIYDDRSGNLWVGTLSGLDRWDRSARSFLHLRHDPEDPGSLSDDRVAAILEDRRGALWVGTEKGLNRLEPDSPEGGFVRFLHDASDPASLSHDLVWSLFEDHQGWLWVGTDGGLSLLRERGFARYLHDAGDLRSLSNDRVMAIHQDRGGVLWIGTQGGGINKWNPATLAFAHYHADPEVPSLSHNAVFAISEDAERQLWIGTVGGGLNKLDRTTDGFTHYRHDPADPSSLASDQVTALAQGDGGTMWVGTAAQGLDLLDLPTGRFSHYRHDPTRPGTLSNDSVSALFKDSAGVLWVATFRGGLNRMVGAAEHFSGTVLGRAPDSDAVFDVFRHDPHDPQSLSEDSLTALAQDAEGKLWVGTFGSGLNRFEGEGAGPRKAALTSLESRRPVRAVFRNVRHDPERASSLSNNTVYAIYRDDAGIFWIGTNVGLNRLEGLGANASFRHYFERDGLASDVIYGIRSDSSGGLWLATTNGLSRLDPRTGTVTNYSASHGLQSDEFNFGAHYRSPSGELFFGGLGGFNAFHPDKIASNASVPPVVLTAFTKLNEPVAFGSSLSQVEEVTLSHRDDLLTFEFAALDYTAPEKNQYRYQLEGLSDTWIDLGPRRRMTFTDLAPGRYVLRVQGSNNDGVWNRKGAAIRMTIAPPFWATPWFRLAGFLAVAGALLAAHRSRMASARRHQQKLAAVERAREREHLIAQLESKNEELERFTYTVSHDLKAPLVTIKGFLGFLRQDAAAGQSERLEHDINLINDAAEKMSVLLEDLLQLSRVGRQVNLPEAVPLDELVSEAVDRVAGQIGERRAEVKVLPDPPVLVGDRARLVELFQNLIENAVKYMGDQAAPRIEIGSRPGGPASTARDVCFVRDNGIGIEPRYHGKIFEIFQRLDAGTEGAGVGLALVKRIVEIHGGSIWVESQGAGHGSTFCFTLGEAPSTLAAS